MKVAVTTAEKNLEGRIDPRFSRCNYFVIVDLQTGNWEAMPNPRLFWQGRGGRSVAQELSDRKVVCVITGRIGPNALAALQVSGIEVYCIETEETVREALHLYRTKQLEKVFEPVR